jgi:rhodanese-related sulfurtransferase
MSRRADRRPRAALRWLRLAALAAVVAVGAGMLAPPGWIGMAEIGPDRLAERLAAGDPDVVVVDVRTGFEYHGGHIRGAVSIPLHRLPFRLRAVQGQEDKELVLICLTGHRSRLGGLILEAAGFPHVTNLDGGMAAWRARGLPEVRGRSPEGPGSAAAPV